MPTPRVMAVRRSRSTGLWVGWLAAVAVCAACGSAAAQRPAVAVKVGGTEVRGPIGNPHLIDQATIQQSHRLLAPADPIRWMRFTDAPAAEPEAYVEFDNGDRVPGRVISQRAEGTTWPLFYGQRPVNLPVTLPATLDISVAADLFVQPPDVPRTGPEPLGIVRVRRDRVRRIVWQKQPPRPHRPRTIFLATGGTVAFKSLRWSEDGVLVIAEGADGPQRYAFADIGELHLPQRGDPWDAWFETLMDDTGGVVRIETLGGARLTTPRGRYNTAPGLHGGNPMVQPSWSIGPLFVDVWTKLSGLSMFSPTEVPLGFMEPSRVVQQSPFGSSWTWRPNRTVQGTPLQPAGVAVGWGFGVQARTELAFPLCDAVKAFRCRVGLDAVVASGGCVRASIHANDAGTLALWQSDILVGSGTSATTGVLPLAGPGGGQNDLLLVADSAHGDRPPGADPFDIRDVVDWVDPLVDLDSAVVPRRVAARVPFVVPALAGCTVTTATDAIVRIEHHMDPSLVHGRAGYVAGVTTAPPGRPVTVRREWKSPGRQDENLVISVSGCGQPGQIEVTVDGCRWQLPVPPRTGVPPPPYVLPLAGRPEGPLVVEITSSGPALQWHALGLTGPLEGDWFPLRMVKAASSAGSSFTAREDGSILVSLPAPAYDDYTIRLASPREGIRALRIDALSLPVLGEPRSLGPGRNVTGAFRMSRLAVRAVAGGKETPLSIVNGVVDPPTNPWIGGWPMDAVAATPGKWWYGPAQTTTSALFHLDGDGAGTAREIVLETGFRAEFFESLGWFRVFGSTASHPRLALPDVTYLVREPDPPGSTPRRVIVGTPLAPGAPQ